MKRYIFLAALLLPMGFPVAVGVFLLRRLVEKNRVKTAEKIAADLGALVVIRDEWPRA